MIKRKEGEADKEGAWDEERMHVRRKRVRERERESYDKVGIGR